MGLIKKAFSFIISPSHSRTFALVGMLVLVSAVSLTVTLSQQQQTLKQRAAGEENGYAQCNFDLYSTCTATTVNADTPTNYGKCLTTTNIPNSDKINDKMLILCDTNNYRQSNDTCMLFRTGAHEDLSPCTPPQPPIDYPFCEGTDLDCDSTSVGGSCQIGKNKCLENEKTSWNTFSTTDIINGHKLLCCGVSAVSPSKDPDCVSLPSAPQKDKACGMKLFKDDCTAAIYDEKPTKTGNDCAADNGQICKDEHVLIGWNAYRCGKSSTAQPPAAPAATAPNNSVKAPAGTTPICVRSGGFYSGPSGTFECCRDENLIKCLNTGTCLTKANCDAATGTVPATGTAPTDTTSNFDCSTPSKDAAGNYQCAPITRGVLECPSDFEIYSYSQTSCPANQGCCKQNPLTPTPTPTQTPTANLFTCANQTGPAAGNYQCATIINGAVQCPSGYGVYSPSNPYTGTSCSANKGCCKQGAATQANLFTCQNQTGTYAGSYACADIVNGVAQCPSNYTAYSPSASFTGTSCGTTRGCCKQNAPTPTPTSTPTPTPTPVPVNNVTLALTLNAQDLPATTSATTSNLSADLTLYNLTTNSTVADAALEKPQSFTKTSITGKQYSKNITLTNLQPVKYFIVARKDNMIAKAVFNVSSTTGTIAVPTTTLVFGDINNDNTIDSLDWNIFRDCWKKPATGSCASSDFNKSGNAVDQIDYNTWLRGLQTWNTEAKNL